MNALVVTVSDSVSAGTAVDTAGPAAVAMLGSAGITADLVVVADGTDTVAAVLRAASADGRPLVITAGGTGLGPRDLTPEGTLRMIDREVPGIAEAIRAASLAVTPHAMLSRGVAGIVGDTLVVNLPGSERAVRESLDVILPVLGHALRLLAGDTSH